MRVVFLSVAIVVILTGFVLMKIGGSSAEGYFAKDIFSFRRIVVAPMVILGGFLFIIFGILFKYLQVWEKNNVLFNGIVFIVCHLRNNHF